MVEQAQSFEELSDSGDFPELDALLASELDKIMTGEFRKNVQIREYELAK